EREFAKKKPYFRREVVEAKVKSLFPGKDPKLILQVLDDDIPTVFGVERTQLNILKLSDGDVNQLVHYVEMAKSGRDFIEVINLAEYPESSRIGMLELDKLPYKEARRILD